jgi:hypothetical protein
MLDVDDPIADLKVGIGRLRSFCDSPVSQARFGPPPAEDLTIG